MTKASLESVSAVAQTANPKLGAFHFDHFKNFYDQGLDSLDHVQILIKMEESFGLTFADHEYDRCDSIYAILVFLEERSKS